MKKMIALVGFSLIVLSFTGCKKDNGEINADLAVSLPGKWELRQRSAAMQPTIQNYLPGNGNIIQFSAQGYEVYETGQLAKKGTFFIVSDTTVAESVCLVFPAGRFTKRIIYNGDTTSDKIFLDITNNRLTFVSGCYAYDAGQTSEYERLPDGKN